MKAPSAKRIQFVGAFGHDAGKCLAREFDFIFVSGDHLLQGIKQDWADWSRRLVSGGVIALHITIVPAHYLGLAELGSCKFVASDIRHEYAFEIAEQADSLNVLRPS